LGIHGLLVTQFKSKQFPSYDAKEAIILMITTVATTLEKYEG